MAAYDFTTLDDKEFEIVCADLLTQVEGQRFERFKPGRDAGVDGRYFAPNGREVVLQCKHWANTPNEQLLRRLRTDELPKVNKLNPQRYLLAVSNALSRAEKRTIAKTFQPYIKSDTDVYAREDLNDLLRKYPTIERSHHKLWLTSAHVLSHIFNKAIHERSAFAIKEALEATPRYVVTSHHGNAIAMLEALGIVVITGEPGIGKTMLAMQLCLHYVARGFTLLKISSDVREAEKAFDADVSQIFYFDDFLGRNYLDALSGHEGSAIVQLIRRISAERNSKRFILTSRSTVLNRAKLLFDDFKNEKLEKKEFELTIKTLSAMDKARILYSHIWRSGLPRELIDAIYEQKRYRDIVSSENYNPRLVSFITDPDRVAGVGRDEYWTYIEEKLANPADIWDHPFMAQQDDFGRAIVVLVTLNDRGLTESDLAEAYTRYISRPQNAAFTGNRDFIFNIRHLTGSLLNRTVAEGAEPNLDLFNPSIGDYVLKRYASDLPTLSAAFRSLRTTTSLRGLRGLVENEIIKPAHGERLLREILCEACESDFIGYDVTYVAKVGAELLRGQQRFSAQEVLQLRKAVAFVLAEDVPAQFFDVATLIAEAAAKHWIDDEAIVGFVLRTCDIGFNQAELQRVAASLRVADTNTAKYEEAQDLLRTAVVDYLRENLGSELAEKDFFSRFTPDAPSYEVESDVRDFLHNRLAEFHLDFDDVSADEIMGAYDVSEDFDDYFKEDSRPIFKEPSHGVSDDDEIDDLFERT